MKNLELDSVEVRGGPVVPVTHSEIDDLEREIGSSFPSGYREYLTRLGWGSLNTLVRVLPPSEVLAQVDEHRGLMASYWSWSEAPEGIDQDWGMESVPVANTFDGDVVAFHPSLPERLVILPRDLDEAFARDEGLLEAIEWICSGRVLRSFGPKRYFEPFGPEPDGPGPEDATNQPAQSPAPVAASAREHLENYFAELRAIEEWVVTTAGVSPKAFRGRNPPEWDIEIDLEAVRRAGQVHARYCTPAMAKGLRGSAPMITWPLPHDPSQFQIRDESSASSRTVFRVAEGIEPGVPAELTEYRLTRTGDDWRIASSRYLGLDDE